MVVLLADEREDGEACLAMAADAVTPASINFMTWQAAGCIDLVLSSGRCSDLGLPLSSAGEGSSGAPLAAITLDAREGIATGISAAEQVHTIRTAVDPSTGSADVVTPGRVQARRVGDNGLLESTGLPEAAMDLARLAGRQPAAVICYVRNQDGSLARHGDLLAFAERHLLKPVCLGDLLVHRRRSERLVERVTEANLPTISVSDATVVGYRALLDGAHHIAIVKGDLANAPEPFVYLHRECLAGNVFHSARCGCGQRLEAALQGIEATGAGVVVYISRLNAGPFDLLRSCDQNQDRDPTTAAGAADDAAELDHEIGKQILGDLGVSPDLILGDPQARPGNRDAARS